jgi:hypothetical protein
MVYFKVFLQIGGTEEHHNNSQNSRSRTEILTHDSVNAKQSVTVLPRLSRRKQITDYLKCSYNLSLNIFNIVQTKAYNAHNSLRNVVKASEFSFR